MATWGPKTPIDLLTFNFWKTYSDAVKVVDTALDVKKATKPAE